MARPIRARNGAGELLEAGWQAQVIGLARIYQWRIYHAPDNRPAGRTGRPQRLAAPEGIGFPDLVLLRAPELLFVELKSNRGRLGPGQADWLRDLGAVGAAITLELEVRDNRGRHGSYAGSKPLVEPAVEAYLWTPDDWDDVQARLSRGRTRREL